MAAAHGVATSYRNERREPVEVDADVVIRVLGLLDVAAGTQGRPARRIDQDWTNSTAQAYWPPRWPCASTDAPSRYRARRHWWPRTACGSTCATRCPATWHPGGIGCTPATVRSPLWWRRRRKCRRRRPPGAGCCSSTRCVRPGRGASVISVICGSSSTWTATEHGAGAVLLNPLHAPGPDASRAALPVHPVQPTVRQSAGVAHRGHRRLPSSRPGHPRRGGRATGLGDHRAHRPRPGVGGQT